MRRFWLCFTSILLPACLRVCCIGIPAYSTFLGRNCLPFMGQGKQLKEKLWLALVFLSPYLLLFPPTLCLLLFVLKSSHSIFFWVSLLLLLFSLHSLFTLLLSSSAFSSSLINTHTHSYSLNTDTQLLGTSAWMCLCVRVWTLFGVKDTFRDVYVRVQW